MKLKFTHVLSPTSNLVLMVYGFFSLFLLFSPSLSQIGMVVAADTISLFFFMLVDRYLFLAIFPEARSIFPVLDSTAFDGAIAECRKLMVRSIYTFPQSRALYLWTISLVKVLPGACIVLLVWPHENLGIALAKMVFFELSLITCFSVLAFFEIHEVASSVIDQLFAHTRDADVFLAVEPSDSGSSLMKVEGLAHISVMSLSFGLMLTLAISTFVGEEPTQRVGFRFAALFLLSCLVLGRLFCTNRMIQVRANRDILHYLGKIDLSRETPILPLHTSVELNALQRAFNLMSGRLRDSQDELSDLIRYESDQSRFRTLGEVAGLVVHDLSSPLHVVKYCTDLIRGDPQKVTDGTLFLRIERSLDKAVNLVQSLRAYLKDGQNGASLIRFAEAHDYVLQVLGLEFQSKLPRQLNEVISVREGVGSVALRCYRIDLIQILDNLYRNSLDNMIETGKETPQIQVALEGVGDGYAVLSLEDSGSGLSVDDFEAMTSGKVSKGGFSDRRAQKGLGLRLTRRLIERLAGSLSVVPAKDGAAGTRMLLTLPLADTKHEEASAEAATHGT
mgnify:CR=1 FL=1